MWTTTFQVVGSVGLGPRHPLLCYCDGASLGIPEAPKGQGGVTGSSCVVDLKTNTVENRVPVDAKSPRVSTRHITAAAALMPAAMAWTGGYGQIGSPSGPCIQCQFQPTKPFQASDGSPNIRRTSHTNPHNRCQSRHLTSIQASIVSPSI